MKRLKKNVLILSVILFFCITAYVIIIFATRTKDEGINKAGENIIELGDGDYISSITLKNASINMDFAYDKVSRTWKLSDDPDFPVYSELIDGMLDKLAAIKTERSISDYSSLSDYGLDAPVFTVKLKSSTGTELLSGIDVAA